MTTWMMHTNLFSIDINFYISHTIWIILFLLLLFGCLSNRILTEVVVATSMLFLVSETLLICLAARRRQTLHLLTCRSFVMSEGDKLIFLFATSFEWIEKGNFGHQKYFDVIRKKN